MVSEQEMPKPSPETPCDLARQTGTATALGDASACA